MRIDIGQASTYKKYKKGFLWSHFEYIFNMVTTILGVPVAKLLYQVFVKEIIRTCSSKKEFIASLRSR